MDTPK